MGITKMLLHQYSACIHCLLHPNHLAERSVIHISIIDYICQQYNYIFCESTSWGASQLHGVESLSSWSRNYPSLRNPSAHYLFLIVGHWAAYFPCTPSHSISFTPALIFFTHLLYSSLSSGLLLPGLTAKFCIHFSSSQCDAHLILLNWSLY